MQDQQPQVPQLASAAYNSLMTSTNPRSVPERMALVGLAANAGLAAIKLVAGMVGNSFALVADAVESLVDIIGSVVIWGALRYGGREADHDHPFGHGKAEALGALAVAWMIVIAGVGIAIQAAHEVFHPHELPQPYTLAVLLGVIAIKEFLFRRTAAAAQTAFSSAGYADAWHHRSDAITSAFALVGITVALVGGAEWAPADDIAAFAASGVIMWNGFRLMREPFSELMDENATDVAMRSREIALSVEGVLGVERQEARKSGRNFRVVMHVEVSPEMQVVDAHTLTGIIKSRVRESIPGTTSVLIHIEPYRGQSRDK